MAAGRKRGRITLAITVESGGWPPLPRLRKLAQRAVDAAAASTRGTPPGELSLLFTDDRRMREINRQWRKVDKATNVLSFPAQEQSAERGTGKPGLPPFLGDIALAFETIDRESSAESLTFEDHLTHLIVHGFLHLIGFDHVKNDEAERMEGLEAAILSGLGIKDPYRPPGA